MGNNFELYRMPRKSLGRAFTLVELLVVVGAIAVLIAILVPSLSYARRRALSAVCLANTRQLNLTLTAYSTNNNGLLFANLYSTSGYWINQMTPYNNRLDGIVLDQNGKVLGSSTNQNLICPAATSFAYDVGNASQGWGPKVSTGAVYNANIAAVCPNGIPSSWSFMDNNGTSPATHNAGGYGLNAWIYNATFPQGSAMANSIQAGTGSKSMLYANALSVTTISGSVTGNATAGGAISRISYRHYYIQRLRRRAAPGSADLQ